MSEHKGEEMKGRTKEAAGTVADDDELKREGKVDRASANIKDAVSDVADSVKDAVSGDDSKR